MSSPKLQTSRRLRATPYSSRVEKHGVSDYSVTNHTLLPKGFGNTVAQDYWHLKEHVQVWDVGCQRQVEVKGPDAAHLAQLMTPRDLRNAQAGQCLYAPIIDDNAGMLNDPVILVLAKDHYWLSIADSDLLLWAKGLAVGMGLDVDINEPDVWPLAVQGPKSDDLMSRVFGNAVRDIRFFQFSTLTFQGHPMIIARSGYSKQGGFEIYLDQPGLGETLWDALFAAGSDLQVAPGSPNLIERIEGGLMSYGNEFNRMNNPLECGLDNYCCFDDDIDYIGKSALMSVRDSGAKMKIRGLIFDGDPCPPCQYPWPLKSDGQSVGFVTSAAWSPLYERNVSLAMLYKGYWQPNTIVEVHCADNTLRRGQVTSLPMPKEVD